MVFSFARAEQRPTRWGDRYNNGRRVINKDAPLKVKAQLGVVRAQKIIRQTIQSILCAPSRKQIQQVQKARFLAETTKIFRNANPGRLDVAAIDRAIIAVIEKFGAYLNPPLESVDNGILESISQNMFRYFQRFVDDKVVAMSPKNVVVFTAIVCDKFSTGWDINGKTVVPQLALFTKHAPPEICYGNIPELDLTCRSMSSLKRKLQAKIISSANHTPMFRYCYNGKD